MPTLTRFYGIAIKMYFLQSEHPPRMFMQYTGRMLEPLISGLEH